MKTSCIFAFACVAFARGTLGAAAFTADGCSSAGTDHAVKESTSGAVRCCHTPNDWCDSDVGGTCFGKDVSFATAQTTCSAFGFRLCTRAELEDGNCCGTGCGYDSEPVWFDNCATNPCGFGSCTATKSSYTCTCNAGFEGTNCDVPVAHTADGCSTAGTSHAVAVAITGAVRCCAADDFCDSDVGGACFGKDVFFATAQATCSSFGYRLCTRAELEHGNCCGTGCGYDSEPVWFDNCAANPCVHGSCTSTKTSYTCACNAGFIGANCEFPEAYTADGCLTAGTPHAVALSTAGAVRCCSDNDFCESDAFGTCFGKDVSFETAKKTCRSLGNRLCTLAELEHGNCCGTGCGYDSEPVWFEN